MKDKTTFWNEAFENAHLNSWPKNAPVSLCVSNRKPPNGRNVFAEDKDFLMASAKKFGFVVVSDLKTNPVAVSFVKKS